MLYTSYIIGSAIGFNLPLIVIGILAVIIAGWSKKVSWIMLLIMAILNTLSLIGQSRSLFQDGLSIKMVVFVLLLVVFSVCISNRSEKRYIPKKNMTSTMRNPDGTVTIRFYLRGSLISQDVYQPGESITIPETPDTVFVSGEKQYFRGWSPVVQSEATGNVDYYAIYQSEEEIKEVTS